MATIYFTAAEFAAQDTAIPAGVFGEETDTGLRKKGPGNWNSLTYVTPPRFDNAFLLNVLPGGTGVDSAATPSTLVARDANGNITTDAFISGVDSTAITAAGTTTLTVDSKQVQEFTGGGGFTQNCDMPTTGVVKERLFVIDNKSNGLITIRSSAGNTITYAPASTVVVLYANTATPTTASHWTVLLASATTGYTSGVPSIAVRDNNNILSSRNFTPAQTIVTTSGGTAALTVGSAFTQIATGTSQHTFTLPTTSVIADHGHEFFNESTLPITINSSAGNLIKTLRPGAWCLVRAKQNAPTAATHWAVQATARTLDPKMLSVTSSATPMSTWNWDVHDELEITALATDITTMSSSLGGTAPASRRPWIATIKDNGTTRNITWGSLFRAIGVTLPAATVAGKYMYVAGKWDPTDAKIHVLSVQQET